MTRRERIITLLKHYVDAEIGFQDRAFRTDDFLPRMSRAWSHPSYYELRRCVCVLQDTSRSMYMALKNEYFDGYDVIRSYCPRCGAFGSPSKAGDLHKHGQGSVQLVLKASRIHPPVNKKALALAIDWLEHEFRGEPFLPDDVLALVV